MDTRTPEHNHLTRDIKPHGVCPGCDRYHLSQMGITTHEAPPVEKTPMYWIGDLHEVACDTCSGRWPVHYIAWVRNPGADPDIVTSRCKMPGCDGTVHWTGEEWSR